jgi:hypothetical protein
VIEVLERLKTMHVGLHAWDSRVLRQPKKQHRVAQRELEEVMRGPINAESDRKKHELSSLNEKLLEEEENRWSQRSLANWLQNGDKNTTYFHNFSTARRKRNFIKMLKNSEGNFVEGTDQLNQVNYYRLLY